MTLHPIKKIRDDKGPDASSRDYDCVIVHLWGRVGAGPRQTFGVTVITREGTFLP